MQKRKPVVGSKVKLTKIGRDFDDIYTKKSYTVTKHYGTLVVFSKEGGGGSYLPVIGSKGIYWEIANPETNTIGGKLC